MKADVFTADHAVAESVSRTESRTFGLSAWFTGFLARRREELAARALRRQLAELDESLLRDIGIGEGEIWKIRQHRDQPVQGW